MPSTFSYSPRPRRATSLLAGAALLLGPGLLHASPVAAATPRPTPRAAGAVRRCATRASKNAKAPATRTRTAGGHGRLPPRCPSASTRKPSLLRPSPAPGLTVTDEDRNIGAPAPGAPIAAPAALGAPGAGESEAAGKTHRRAGGGGSAGSGEPAETGEVLTDPVDSSYLTGMPFGTSSFWLEPWRAYMDTWPASTLLDSLGINFNVRPPDAEAVAQLLQESGFKLARREIPWSALSYEDPTQFTNEAKIAGILSALHKHGLRPLILLNANSGQPGPARPISLTTVAEAAPGASTVTLDAASAAEVVPGKTGFDELTFGTGPDILITSVGAGDVATLSRPLVKALPAGKHRAMTLRYAPFQAPKLANGQPNPVFEETLAGWESYVATVSKLAAGICGPEGYDLEVWNELSFGSQFLNYEHYYQVSAPTAAAAAAVADHQEDAETEESVESRENSEAMDKKEAEIEAGSESEAASETSAAAGSEGDSEPESASAAAPQTEVEATPQSEAATEGEAEAASRQKEGGQAPEIAVSKEVTREIRRALLKETVAYVRNPANGIPAGVGISDGFASQTPFPSGADAPVGLTALSKHLYNGAKTYPAGYPNNRIRPLNALGVRDTEPGNAFKPLFIPSFQSLFPEFYLSGLTTETITRDIAPITTDIYGLPHGREVGPAGGSPVQKWMTEYNLSPNRGVPVGPDGVTPAGVALTPADKAHFQAKALLRGLVAMVNKGLSREYFYGAGPGGLSLIDKNFYSALEAHPETYPGTELGGETMTGFRHMLAHFQGPGPGSSLRQLTLDSIAQTGNHAQFTGDGSTAHPSLYDRDVLAVLPFQSSPTRFVIPVYVMTLDLVTLYEPEQPSSDIHRFDLPNETFRITLGNLPETSEPPTVSAYDPLRDESTPARLLSQQGSSAEFEIAATDYPRLLTIEYPA